VVFGRIEALSIGGQKVSRHPLAWNAPVYEACRQDRATRVHFSDEELVG
jgi:hypothetical protein